MSSGPPKIRLMQAGKYTAVAPARVVTGSCPGAASGISGIQVGSTSGLTATLPSSVIPEISPSPVTELTPCAERTETRPSRSMNR